MNPRWDEQIKVNRVEYDSMMQALCKPISKDLCPIILRLEHTVTELSKLSDQSQGEGGERERERERVRVIVGTPHFVLHVCMIVSVVVTFCLLTTGAQINVPLQCGIALFYKIVEFIGPEIRQFPPTCQILTTCIQLLGQVNLSILLKLHVV